MKLLLFPLSGSRIARCPLTRATSGKRAQRMQERASDLAAKRIYMSAYVAFRLDGGSMPKVNFPWLARRNRATPVRRLRRVGLRERDERGDADRRQAKFSSDTAAGISERKVIRISHFYFSCSRHSANGKPIGKRQNQTKNEPRKKKYDLRISCPDGIYFSTVMPFI